MNFTRTDLGEIAEGTHNMYLETGRLAIRPYIESDFDDYFDYIMEPELQYMLGLHDINSRKSAYEAFQWLMENREFYAVIIKETGKVIGHICIHPQHMQISKEADFKDKTGYSLSFAMAKPYRRKGFMEEALRALIDELFMHRNANFIDCEYATFNKASHALQEKLGFSYHCKEQFGDVELITNVLRREEWNGK